MSRESVMCTICGALVAWSPNQQEVYKHSNWHKEIREQINHAASVGAHADIMTKPIGGSK